MLSIGLVSASGRSGFGVRVVKIVLKPRIHGAPGRAGECVPATRWRFGHMGVAKEGDSQTLSGLYCHVEENLCEVARVDRALACSKTGSPCRQTGFEFLAQTAQSAGPR